MGYKYQFITLAGIHNMWYNMFDLAYDYARGEGMKHYVEKVQEPNSRPATRVTPSFPTSRKWRRLLRRCDHHHSGWRIIGNRADRFH